MRAHALRLGMLGTALAALGPAGHVWQASVAPPAANARTQPAHFPLQESKARLKLVQVVFRHGARTPLSSKEDLWRSVGAEWDVCGEAYRAVPLALKTSDGGPVPPNPHNLKQVSRVLPGGCHMGQLTRRGQQQARELGEWLRQRYVHQFGLLPEAYQEGMVAARTTNFQRTIGTLAGVLTGLLGPGGSPAPVPAITSTDLDEILYADTKQCPHLKLYMRMCLETAHGLVRGDPDYPWAVEQLRRLGVLSPGVEPREWVFADVHDTVTALAAAGKEIPHGFTPRLIAVVNRLATKEFAPLVAPSVRDAHGHAVLRLSLGVLLHTLVANMQAAVAAESGSSGQGEDGGRSALPRLHLFSGHDSSVMPILSALGADVLQSWPPFLSNVVFELWQLPDEEGGHHVVRVLFNKGELDIPHCPQGQYATLEAFKGEVIGPFLISAADISEACRMPIEHDTSMPHLAGQEEEDVSLSAPTSSSAGSGKDGA